MSDERRDDEIIGRALSRAIETMDVNQTPFERSRLATAPARRSIFGVWQLATAAAAIVLAVAIGSWLARPLEAGPVAGSPAPTVAPATQTGATQTPAPSGASVSTRVFFVRNLVPPVSANLPSGGAHIPVDSVVERISVAHAAPSSSLPAGAVNPLGFVPLRADGTSVSAKINGDTADVEFDVSGGWGVHGAAQVQALVQQLVYVITEEPGVHKARITEKGKTSAVIDGFIVDQPLSREDVSGYGGSQASGPASTITSGGAKVAGLTVATSYSVDAVAPGLARFVITLTGPGGAAAALPSFTAYLDRTEEPNFGKASIYVEVATEPSPTGLTVVDRSPLRAIRAIIGFGSPTQVGGAAFVLGLDDARPWRVFTLANPTRIVIDIGGAPQATSDRISVYGPTPGSTIDSRISRTFTVSGAARVFEANVSWRLKDASGKTEASGHFLASLGSSAVWGTFDAPITIPTSLQSTGAATLELYEASPKDGSEQGLVAIPLMIR